MNFFAIVFPLVFLLGAVGIFYLGIRLQKYPPFRGKHWAIRLLSFPTGLIGVWFGGNDLCYGKEVRANTTFIIFSGISGWTMPFKTGCISEIVTIRVTEE